MRKTLLAEYVVMAGLTVQTLIWAPHDLWAIRQSKKKAARNQKIYKEMYRGKYGY